MTIIASSLMINKNDNFILPLNIATNTIIDQRYIDEAYKEAASYPDGSRERKAFLTYAHSLEKRLVRQKELDKK